MSKPVSIAVGNRRLLKLADFLDKLPRKRFTYDRWVAEDWTEKSCGTAGCALGWAASMPAFQRLGLSISDVYGLPAPAFNDGLQGPMAAARAIFGEEQAVIDLFVPSTDAEEKATPKYVARKIRKFVKARGGAAR